jgi:CheY-like chemotaxis protein
MRERATGDGSGERTADLGGAKLRVAVREAARRIVGGPLRVPEREEAGRTPVDGPSRDPAGSAFRSSTPASATVAESSGYPSGNVAAVLVVETDPDLQWRIARQLTVRGHRVVGTGSPEGALALLDAWPVDLVLIDADLRTDSGTTAVDLARLVRARHPEVRVAVMTGQPPREEQRLAARLAGAVACLTKPFRAEAVAEVLSKRPDAVLPLSLVPVV